MVNLRTTTWRTSKFKTGKLKPWRAFLPAIRAFYESEEGKAVAAQLEQERVSKGLPPTSESTRKRPRRRKRR